MLVAARRPWLSLLDSASQSHSSLVSVTGISWFVCLVAGGRSNSWGCLLLRRLPWGGRRLAVDRWFLGCSDGGGKWEEEEAKHSGDGYPRDGEDYDMYCSS